MSSFVGKIRAITFDAGHTLIEPSVSVGQAYAAAAARHGCSGLSSDELERRFIAVLQACGGAVNTREDWERIVDDTFVGLVDSPPSNTFFTELFDHFAAPSAWRIYEDVLPTLDELAQRGFRLGIISNWDDRLRALLAALGLATCFEVMVISCEVGYSKPARGIFDTAMHQLGLPPAEILHVGDSWSADIEGARAAGFRAVQIARGSPASANRIASLHELVDMVARPAR